MSWRSSIPVHDAANLFPLIEDQDELIKIGTDIKDHGLISPIGIVVENGNAILADGRNRLDAMELVGLKISLVKTTTGGWRLVAKENLTEIDIHKRIGATVNVVTTDPWDYVISVNMHRRHLTGEQKREVVAKLLEANPERSNRSIARVAKVDDKTVGTIRRELEATAEIPQLDKRTGKDGKARPAKATTRRPNPPSIDSESYDIEEAIGARSLFDSQTLLPFNSYDIGEAIGARSLFDSQTSQLFDNYAAESAEAKSDQNEVASGESYTLSDINAMAVMPERPWDEEKQAWLDRRMVMAVNILIQSKKWRVNLVNLDNGGAASWPLYAKADLDKLISDLQELNKHLAPLRGVQKKKQEPEAATPKTEGTKADQVRSIDRAKAALRDNHNLTKREVMEKAGVTSNMAVKARAQLEGSGEIPPALKKRKAPAIVAKAQAVK